jgi:tRNA1(Val) A37 N6-methylase TrmN6
MFLIEAVKEGRPHLKIEPPLFIYAGAGRYTDEALAILGL